MSFTNTQKLSVPESLRIKVQQENIAHHNGWAFKAIIDNIKYQTDGVHYGANRYTSLTKHKVSLHREAMCRICQEHYRYIPEDIFDLIKKNEEGLLYINDKIPLHCVVCLKITSDYCPRIKQFIDSPSMSDFKAYRSDYIKEEQLIMSKTLHNEVCQMIDNNIKICRFCLLSRYECYDEDKSGDAESDFTVGYKITNTPPYLLMIISQFGSDYDNYGNSVRQLRWCKEKPFLLCQCPPTYKIPPDPLGEPKFQKYFYIEIRNKISQSYCICDRVKEREASVCNACKFDFAAIYLPAIVVCVAINHRRRTYKDVVLSSVKT